LGDTKNGPERQPPPPKETSEQATVPRVDRRRDFCHHCGEAVPKGVSICPTCGQLVFHQRFLGEILIDEGFISRDKLQEALRLQKRRLGEILVDIGACQAEDLDRALTLQRLGRTRADIYYRYHKVAIILLAVSIGGLIYAVVKLDRNNQFLARMHRRELSVSEVNEVLNSNSSYSKIEALRSLIDHLNNPAAKPVLSCALRHEQWEVKLYGIVLARKSKNPALIPDLLEVMKQDPEIVAPVAQDAIQAITESQVGTAASNRQPDLSTLFSVPPYAKPSASPSPRPNRF
jgi:hypothetical protein